MIKTRAWAIYIFGLPADLVCSVFAFLLAPYQEGMGEMTLERRSRGAGLWALTLDVRWLPSNWAAITIAPHVIIYRSGRHFAQACEHEHRHCKRYEAAGAMASLLVLVSVVLGAPWQVALVMWVLGPWLYMLAGYVIAWLHGEVLRRDSHSEPVYAVLTDRSNR